MYLKKKKTFTILISLRFPEIVHDSYSDTHVTIQLDSVDGNPWVDRAGIIRFILPA